jgi:Rrf2 family protein
MKLLRASGYAVCALVYLARKGSGGPVTSEAIARAVGMPRLFLLKVLNSLGRARLLLAAKGPNGGYRLARPAKGITLLDIVEAVDGPVRGEAPPVAAAGGGKLDRRLQAECDEAAEVVREGLQGVSVADLAGRGK